MRHVVSRDAVRPVAPPRRQPLIAALDTPDRSRLATLAQALAPYVGYLKVGLEAFTALGKDAVDVAGRHAPVFLDLKLHDIPNTVAGAASAAGRLGAAMLTVHASGGPRMVAAAAEAAPDTIILAVTVLTSLDDTDLAAMALPPAADQVPRLAALAVDAGARGVVCSPHEVAAVRAAVGSGPVLVVPGVRPAGGPGTPWPDGASAGDQARVATPRAARDAGADYVVVGRPLTAVADAAAAARLLLTELP